MQRTNRFLAIVPPLTLLFLSAGISGCISSSAPSGWHPKVNELKNDLHGGWVQIYSKERRSRKKLICEGELIAVHDDNILCYGVELQVIDKTDVDYLKLFGYDSNYQKLSGWNGLGIVGSLSHGLLAFATIPVWILFGGSAVSAQAKQPYISYAPNRQGKWMQLRIYARFPQGLPDGVRPEQLQPKVALTQEKGRSGKLKSRPGDR